MLNAKALKKNAHMFHSRRAKIDKIYGAIDDEFRYNTSISKAPILRTERERAQRNNAGTMTPAGRVNSIIKQMKGQQKQFKEVRNEL